MQDCLRKRLGKLVWFIFFLLLPVGYIALSLSFSLSLSLSLSLWPGWKWSLLDKPCFFAPFRPFLCLQMKLIKFPIVTFKGREMFHYVEVLRNCSCYSIFLFCVLKRDFSSARRFAAGPFQINCRKKSPGERMGGWKKFMNILGALPSFCSPWCIRAAPRDAFPVSRKFSRKNVQPAL